MRAITIVLTATIILLCVFFQEQACGQTPGITQIATDKAWLGHEGSVNISYTLVDAAICDVFLQVSDEGAAVVRTTDIGLQGSGTYTVAWDGCDNSGAHVPEGTYALQVYAIDYNSLPEQPAGIWKWLLDPHSMAIDSGGNVFVIDFTSLRVFIPGGGDVTLFQWSDPIKGMALDTGGNVYAMDDQNGTAYVIHPDGTFALLATGLSNVTAMAAGDGGNVYVASLDDNVIKHIYPNGTVAEVGNCEDLAVALTADAAGNVYVVDVNGDLTKFSADGTRTRLFQGMLGTSGIAVDGQGNIYLSSMLDHSIKKLAPDRSITTLSYLFVSPTFLTLDAIGNIYVIDMGYLLSIPSTKFIKILHPDGSISVLGPDVSHPPHLAVRDPGTLYVADGDGTVKRLDGSGTTRLWDTSFYQPNIAVDAQGTLYISDKLQSSIIALHPDGTSETLGGCFLFPSGIAVDEGGNVYVADTFNSAVKVIRPNGTIESLGSGFEDPWDVAVDSFGNVYVADGVTDGGIKKICPDGTTVTLCSGYYFPHSVAADKAGNVYFIDIQNAAVMAIRRDGTITTLTASDFMITDLAVDMQGSLYIDCFEAIYVLSRPVVAGNPAGVGVDLTPPSTTCQLAGTLDQGSYVDTVQVSLTAADVLSGVSTTLYNVDDGLWSVYQTEFSVTEQGIHTVHYNSVDNVGNVEANQSTSFAIGPVVASFTADVTSGAAPLTVYFQDQSSGNPDYWLWDLGDGSRSWSHNPLYTYQTPGTYTVSLTVSNGFSTDTLTKTNLIHVYRGSTSFTIPLKQGWNLISIPLEINPIQADSLADLGVTEVAWYDTSSGKYDIFLVGLSPGSMTLSDDRGYFLYCSRDSSLVVTGYATSGESATLQPGWNLLGWPTLDDSDVRVVSASVSGTQEIARYVAGRSGFDVYLEGRTPAAFDMKPGEGYFVYTSAAGTLNYNAVCGD